MRSLAAIRRDAQVGIDLSPLERAINKFVQTSGPAVLAAGATALLVALQGQADIPTALKAGAAALGTAALNALWKYWKAAQDTPSSTPVVEPEAPTAQDDSASVATYPVDGSVVTVQYAGSTTKAYVDAPVVADSTSLATDSADVPSDTPEAATAS